MPQSLALAAAHFGAVFHGLTAAAPDWAKRRPPVPGRGEPLALHDAVDALLLYDRAEPGRALSAAFLAYARALTRQREPHADQWRLLDEALVRLHEGQGFPDESASPEMAFLHSLQGFSNFAGCVRNFSWEMVYDLDLESTNVIITVVAERAVTEYTNLIDPQNWEITAPDTFLGAYRMRDNVSPSDPFALPAPAVPLHRVPPWSGKFFEHAQWAMNGFAFSDFRNVLNISYVPVVGQANMAYELHENLVQNVLGTQELGGLDIDSGDVEVADVTVIGGLTLTRMTASKRLRFRAPVGLKTYLNWLNPPLLTMWMLQSIVGSACMQGP